MAEQKTNLSSRAGKQLRNMSDESASHLKNAVERIAREPAVLMQYLSMLSRFLLIKDFEPLCLFDQNPFVSAVRTRKEWNELGYTVTDDDSKALVVPYFENWYTDEVIGYRYLFDISQTDAVLKDSRLMFERDHMIIYRSLLNLYEQCSVEIRFIESDDAPDRKFEFGASFDEENKVLYIIKGEGESYQFARMLLWQFIPVNSVKFFNFPVPNEFIRQAVMYALCTHFDIGYYSYHQLAPPKEWETEGFDRVRDDLELIRCYYSAIVILMDDAIYKQREKKAADVQSESVRKQKDENKLLRFQVPTGTTHISIS